MNILLVDPVETSPVVAPSGLIYLSEHLKASRHKVKILRFPLPEELSRESANGYDVIGFSVRNIDTARMGAQGFFLPKIKGLVHIARENSKAHIVLGGAGVGLFPGLVRNFFGEYADCIIAGDGASGMDELLRLISGGCKIPKIIQDSGCFNPANAPSWATLKQLKYPKDGFVGVQSKKGCPLACTYCAYPHFEGKIALKKPETVVREIASLAKMGYRKIYFADPTFNIPKEHAKQVCRAIIRRNIGISWRGIINPGAEYVDAELFRLFRDSGITAVEFSDLDTCSPAMLRSLNKNFTLREIFNAAGLARSAGLKVCFSLTFGAPGESVKTVRECFRNLDLLAPDSVTITAGFRIYPDTTLASIAKEQRIICRSSPLLEPVFYPVSKAVLGEIFRQGAKRKNCILPPSELLEAAQ